MKEKIKKIIYTLFPKLYYKILIARNGFNPKCIDKKIMKFNNMGIEERKYGDNELIISLTSYPARMEKLHYTLFSLLNQKKKPNKIILWLGYDRFPNKEQDIPENVKSLLKYGITIEWCKDLRSYTKLIPAYIRYPDSIIVTADDDIFYPEIWLESLYNSYLIDKNAVHCHRGQRIEYNNNNFKPYKSWKTNMLPEKSYLNFLLGVWGVLYPPHSLFNDITKSDLFLKLAPNADDIWFWAMAVLNKTKIKTILDIKRFKYTDPKKEYIPEYADTLHYLNVGNLQNEVQLDNVCRFYPELLKLLENNG